MKTTLTFKRLDGDPEIFDLNSMSDSDYCSIHIAKYYSAQNRTYFAKDGITLDTVSIHSNGDNIGLRFYYKNSRIDNKRKAIYSQILLETVNAVDLIENDLKGSCDKLAQEAVEDIKHRFEEI